MAYQYYREKYDVAPTFRFNGEGIIFFGDGKIICGEGGHIGRHSLVSAQDGREIRIGKETAIGPFFEAHTIAKKADQDFSGETKEAAGNIIIGDYCWIGRGVFVREGVTIGNNSVIGANSVVVEDIPPNCIAAGCPAKIIRMKTKQIKQE